MIETSLKSACFVFRLCSCFADFRFTRVGRAQAGTAWNGHAFFEKASGPWWMRRSCCRQRQDSSTSEFSKWKLWPERSVVGHFWSGRLGRRAGPAARRRAPAGGTPRTLRVVRLRLQALRGDNTAAARTGRDVQALWCPITAQTCKLDTSFLCAKPTRTGLGALGLVLRMPQSQDQYGGNRVAMHLPVCFQAAQKS